MLKDIKSQVGNLNQTLTTGSQEESRSQVISERVRQLFYIFKSNYTSKFTSNYKSADAVNVAMSMWESMTFHIDDDTFQKATMKVIIQFDWPPTVSDFIRVVATMKSPERSQTKLLMPPRASEETARKHINKWREILNNKGEDEDDDIKPLGPAGPACESCNE